MMFHLMLPLPLGLLNVPCDEVMVHVEQTNPDEVEDHIQSVAKTYCLLVCHTKCTNSCILREEQGEGKSVGD